MSSLPFNHFAHRHIGPNSEEQSEQLAAIGIKDIDQLMEEVVPSDIRWKDQIDFPTALNEYEYLEMIREKGAKNRVFRSFIGLGYHQTITPSPILRNIFENPAWYTPYTPYQSEIAQGRLEALLNFQTMVCDLTGMEIANASLLDEGTAAVEAMMLLFRAEKRKRKQTAKNLFLVSNDCFPQTIEVLQTRAIPLDIEIKLVEEKDLLAYPDAFGALLQYPGQNGNLVDYSKISSQLNSHGIKFAVASDLLSLCLLKPPGEWGAEIVLGTTQNFGIPLGYGGPHAAYFATKESHKRNLPGRIIGVAEDALGNRALRMALQTREQHIRREKATSNICTAQALLASMAGMYAVYHGPQRLRKITEKIHKSCCYLLEALNSIGFSPKNEHFYNTLEFEMEVEALSTFRSLSLAKGYNFRYRSPELVSISLDETCSLKNLEDIIEIFAATLGLDKTSLTLTPLEDLTMRIPANLLRQTAILSHPIFNSYHSEIRMMRYIKSLERKDIGLNQSMIPLGSCTMKLNAATQLIPLSWPCFSQIHPFAPIDQATAYQDIFQELEEMLCILTGFSACSLQPNSGAQGELAGLLTIRNFHQSRGESYRNIVLIPSSAHGTNPASAVLSGMQVVVVLCDEDGNIDLSDLEAKAAKHQKELSAMMITYPSTHGVFETGVRQATHIIHKNGGLVYMDGANMNAQICYTNPALIGADVCHLNLHKTFAIPHGGGGPGVGPICCTEQLANFLPGHGFLKATKKRDQEGAVSSAPWGSASILLISYAYLRLLSWEGLRKSTAAAILNANYIKKKLAEHYEVLYVGEHEHVAHELILDLRPFKKSAGIEVADVAKRLMDYGYHAPTVSFPVPGTIMIEPTESEGKEELDRFCLAMISIRKEIAAIENGNTTQGNNLLVNAPHTLDIVTNDTWEYPYSRQEAAWPLDWVKTRKLWPTVGRIDQGKGDRQLICTCPPIESYQKSD